MAVCGAYKRYYQPPPKSLSSFLFSISLIFILYSGQAGVRKVHQNSIYACKTVGTQFIASGDSSRFLFDSSCSLFEDAR